MHATHFEWWVKERLIPWVRSELGDLEVRGAGLIFDQLSAHLSESVRGLLGEAGIAPLPLYPKTSDRCSPLDMGFFGVFKNMVRERLVDSARDAGAAEVVVREVIECMRENPRAIVNYFRGCGIDGSAYRGRDYLPPVPALSVLPFGRPPPEARLGRVQKAKDLRFVKRSGRPKKEPEEKEERERPRNHDRFTVEEKKMLEDEFAKNPSPSRERRSAIAGQIQKEIGRISAWFSFKRYKTRRNGPEIKLS